MRAFAFLFGIVFLVIGIAGFIPEVVHEEYLVEVFHVNIWLNLLHVFSGVIAFFVGFIGRKSSRIYFQIFGVLYAILAILGFVYEDKDIFGILSSNAPDTWFHVIMATAALIVGYGAKD